MAEFVGGFEEMQNEKYRRRHEEEVACYIDSRLLPWSEQAPRLVGTEAPA